MRAQSRIRPLHSLERRIEDGARAEAERQARRVAWLTLWEYRKQYIEWEAFTLWVHAIEEAERRAPEWLCRTVENSCPGIKRSQDSKLWKCLDAWKQKTIFAKPKREGWMRGVSFFAVRDLVYSRAWAYWGYCEQQWSFRRPASYPSFDEWKAAADNCPDEVLTLSGLREERKELAKAARRAGGERLGRAVGIYLEIEAFAYWLRPILDARLLLPGSVRDEIKNRYPFLELHDECNWNQMWDCLKDSHFQEAQTENWYEPVVYTAELHPRRVKVIDYFSVYWSGHWRKEKAQAYPPFEIWRRKAESYAPDT
ncbi:MAG: hypothetical protein ACLQVM_18740 [Terriglobia bacterium]